MAENEGLITFEDAVGEALAELGEVTPAQPKATLPVAEEEAEVFGDEVSTTVVEQPESEADPEELFDDSDVVTEVEQPIDWDSFTFEVPGVEEPKSVRELVDGYLRQSDYTRKTQEVARIRQEAEDAIGFWEALRGDPVGILQQLSAEAGIIEEGQAPVRKINFSPFHTAEQTEQEIQRRVEQAVLAHPMVQQASMQTAIGAVDAEFHRLESEYQTKLGPKSRKAILEKAVQTGTPDLELVFNGMLAAKARKQAGAQTAKAAAPGRPSGRSVQTELTEPADSVESAFERALVAAGVK